MANSAFVTATSTVLVLLLAVPAAYALSLAAVPGTRDALGFFLSTKMLPAVAAIIPRSPRARPDRQRSAD